MWKDLLVVVLASVASAILITGTLFLIIYIFWPEQFENDKIPRT